MKIIVTFLKFKCVLAAYILTKFKCLKTDYT
jgi:hypothetical protein